MPRGFGGQSQQRWGDNTINQNEILRDIQLMDLSGKVCNTADARKKGMLVLAFFSTTDADSRKTLLALQKLADAYKTAGKLSVWGVSQDDEAATRALLTEENISFPVLLDYGKYHAMLYGLTTVPTVYFADGGGQVLRKVAGFKPVALNDISTKAALAAEMEAVVLVETNPTSVAA